jgi:hypothetical protein
MKVSNAFDRILRKVGVKNNPVPVLCHGCGNMIGIPRDQIQFIELGDSPCCGETISPPPKRMKPGKIWDKFGGERLGKNNNPDPDVNATTVIKSLEDIDKKR